MRGPTLRTPTLLGLGEDRFDEGGHEAGPLSGLYAGFFGRCIEVIRGAKLEKYLLENLPKMAVHSANTVGNIVI